MRRSNLLISFLVSAALVLPVSAETSTPNVRKQDVEERFGERLENASRSESLLLLGIALDTVNANSNFKGQQIGIPYLVGDGAGYWALLLTQGIQSVDVLVNNALMLLFADKDDKSLSQAERVAAAVKLLTAAEAEGYWPATAYLAEHYFNLASQAVQPPMMPDSKIQNGYRKVAFDWYRACAETGFAPCHFKVGLWYVADQKVEAGLPFLKAGVELVRRDKRYLTVPDVVSDASFVLKLLSSPTLDNTEQELQMIAALQSELQSL